MEIISQICPKKIDLCIGYLHHQEAELLMLHYSWCQHCENGMLLCQQLYLIFLQESGQEEEKKSTSNHPCQCEKMPCEVHSP